jgi:hypothetical protein
MQGLRIWTITSLERRKWFARRKRYFAEATGTFSALYAYQGMNQNQLPGCFLISPAVPGKNEVF